MTCAATTVIAGASLAVAAAGTAATVSAQSRAAGAASAAAGTNAQYARQNAQLAQQRAEADAADIAVGTRKAQGSTRAAAGASGLVVEDGSPLEALLDNAATGELNRQRRLWAGDMEGRGYMVDASGEDLRGWQAGQKSFGAFATGGASLLNAGSKLADRLFSSSGGSKYDLGADTVRTAGDRDLGGYN